ncbi:DUF4386 family protein [Spirillospora sp. CA-294931]|uniref:DUF4386 family protein n=1 Tax=Spirillospora sp. CA-294931 TaxID=3240042 RepID=UPI003D934604
MTDLPAPMRTLGIAVLAGTVLYIVPSALHGNPPIDSAAQTLEYVRDRPTWRPAHMINIAAVLLWAVSFTALTRLAAPASRFLGTAVTAVATAAAAVFAVYFSVHAFGLTTAADQYFERGANRAAILERTETLLIVLGSTAFTAQAMLGALVALTGYTLTRSRTLPPWLGWWAVLAGLGWLTGALFISFAVIVPFTALTWAWTFVVAFTLWRRPGFWAGDIRPSQGEAAPSSVGGT